MIDCNVVRCMEKHNCHPPTHTPQQLFVHEK